MPRKFDFDYNFDPAGTSVVQPDPYTDNSDESLATKGNPSSKNPHDGQRSSSPLSAGGNSFRPKSRSKSPQPPSPKEPSPEYLAISTESSSKLDFVRSQRKLLILDLNGTLVFRSPHQKKNAYQSRGNQRPLRTVHRRPYLQAFTDYIFHPRVREWLDTMVWSSAQPHSVSDMTDQCFPGRKDELVAIWARDTLGLKQEDYHRKTQTTKNLAKPWADSRIARLGHSAKSTLLLDDSPLKAHLQPWNHLCIKEYVADMRKNDVKVRDAERLKEIQEEKMENEELEEEYLRKRKATKKAQGLADRVVQAAAEATDDDGRPRAYDGTLLAVIGILDAAKEESNVAGWMRAGGLLNVVRPSRSGTPGPMKKRRDSDGDVASDSDIALEKSSSPAPPPSSLPPSSSPSPLEEMQDETGVPLEENSSHAPHLWFDHPDAFQHWVHRGRQALDALDIPINHGIIGSMS